MQCKRDRTVAGAFCDRLFARTGQTVELCEAREASVSDELCNKQIVCYTARLFGKMHPCRATRAEFWLLPSTSEVTWYSRLADRVKLRGIQTGRDRVKSRGILTGRDRVKLRGIQTGRDRVKSRGIQTGRDRVKSRGIQTGRDRVKLRGIQTGRDRVKLRGIQTGRDRVKSRGIQTGRDRVKLRGIQTGRDKGEVTLYSDW